MCVHCLGSHTSADFVWMKTSPSAPAGYSGTGLMVTSRPQFCSRRGKHAFWYLHHSVIILFLEMSKKKKKKKSVGKWKLQPRKTGVVVVLVGLTLVPPAGFRLLNRVSVGGGDSESHKISWPHQLSASQPGGVLIVRTILSVFRSGMPVWWKKFWKRKGVQFLGSLALFSLFNWNLWSEKGL